MPRPHCFGRSGRKMGTKNSKKKKPERPIEVGLYRFPHSERLYFAVFAIQRCCWGGSKRRRWPWAGRRDPAPNLWQVSQSLALKVAAWVWEPNHRCPRSAWLGLERPVPRSPQAAPTCDSGHPLTDLIAHADGKSCHWCGDAVSKGDHVLSCAECDSSYAQLRHRWICDTCGEKMKAVTDVPTYEILMLAGQCGTL